jgi:hypothetical protein
MTAFYRPYGEHRVPVYANLRRDIRGRLDGAKLEMVNGEGRTVNRDRGSSSSPLSVGAPICQSKILMTTLL